MKKDDKDGFNREDSGRKNEHGAVPFAKDKRARIKIVEKNIPSPRHDRDHEKPERRSYNPNFTPNNKLRERDDNRHHHIGGDKPYRSEGGRPYRNDEKKPYRSDDNKPYRNDRDRRPPFPKGDRPVGQNDGNGNRGGYRNDRDRTPRQGSDRYQPSRNRNDNREPHSYNSGYKSWDDEKFNRRDYTPGETRNRKDDGRRDFGRDKGSFKQAGKPHTYGNRNQDFQKGKYSPKQAGITKNRIYDDTGKRSDGSYPAFPAPKIESEMRLNRYIAASGACSRREADEKIKLGLVSVNGRVVTEMGSKIAPGDEVRFDGNLVQSEKKVYIVMNKPKGYVTTLDDPHAEKTVMDLLKNSCTERVYPVGRLDKNSLGVLLITNDGDLTKQLTHPAYNKKKIYQATLDKALTRADMERIAEGITLDDGEIHADGVNYVGDSRKEIGIEIHSGRNRIVRRIFEHLGYKVVKLDRVYFAGLTKKNLRRGAWRFLSPREVDMLRSGMYE